MTLHPPFVEQLSLRPGKKTRHRYRVCASDIHPGLLPDKNDSAYVPFAAADILLRWCLKVKPVTRE
jgi:hypothetical protein